jgi:hypothetical protein
MTWIVRGSQSGSARPPGSAAATFVRRCIDFKWSAGRLAAPLLISPTIPEVEVPSARPSARPAGTALSIDRGESQKPQNEQIWNYEARH